MAGVPDVINLLSQRPEVPGGLAAGGGAANQDNGDPNVNGHGHGGTCATPQLACSFTRPTFTTVTVCMVTHASTLFFSFRVAAAAASFLSFRHTIYFLPPHRPRQPRGLQPGAYHRRREDRRERHYLTAPAAPLRELPLHARRPLEGRGLHSPRPLLSST